MHFAYKLMSYGQLNAVKSFGTHFFVSNLLLSVNRTRVANLRKKIDSTVFKDISTYIPD
jgi:hypothetical protein